MTESCSLRTIISSKGSGVALRSNKWQIINLRFLIELTSEGSTRSAWDAGQPTCRKAYAAHRSFKSFKFFFEVEGEPRMARLRAVGEPSAP